jgi:acetyl-CoA C-acetyltransferase
VEPEAVEDVVFAQSYANSEAPCIGRWAALNAGLPIGVPGLQIDRRCGGGLQAVVTAAMTVQTGVADVVLAGGVESMSNIEHYTTTARWGARSGNQTLSTCSRSPSPNTTTTSTASTGTSLVTR